MIEMRWLVEGSGRKLQYRQRIDKTKSQHEGWVVTSQTVNLQWTDWTDVPNVEQEEMVHASS
jgi:hypothetical protein